MKYIVLIITVSYAYSMDRPPSSNTKREPSPYVKAARNFFSSWNFRTMLERGQKVSFNDLDDLIDMNIPGNKLFWMSFGFDFLIMANFATPEPLSLRDAAAKQVGKNIAESKQDYLRLVQRLPQDLRVLVIGMNPELLLARLKDLLDVGVKVEKRSEIKKLKNKLALSLWSAMLAHESIPYAIDILTKLRNSKPGPQNAEVINKMIDSLVKKICENIEMIRTYLREKNALNKLIADVRIAFNERILQLAQWGDTSIETKQRNMLMKLLSSPTACAVLVKERLLELD